MRCGTILAALADAGVQTAAITAKDKLRLMLSRGLKGINFSSEHADRATVEKNGIGDVEKMVGRAKPDQYSGDLSLYVLDAGLALLQRKAATLLYLSLSDFIQHAHAPGHARGRRLQPRRRRPDRAPHGGGSGGRCRRRSWHERQVAAHGRAQCGVPAGGAERALR
jgi:phosphonoacetate hydrolase